MQSIKLSPEEQEQFIRQEIENLIKTIVTLSGLTQEDFDALRTLAPVCRSWADDIARHIKERLLTFPNGEAYLDTYLNGDLAGWYRSLFEVTDVDAFWASQIDMAISHARHNVPNEVIVGLAPFWIELSNVYAHRFLDRDRVLTCVRVVTRVLGGTVALMVSMREIVMFHTFMETTGFSKTLIERLWQNTLERFTDRLQRVKAEYFMERASSA